MIPLIKTDRGYVQVSDEPIKKGDKVLHYGEILTAGEYDSWFNKWDFIEKSIAPVNYDKECKKVILSSFKLEGVPQFELEDWKENLFDLMNVETFPNVKNLHEQALAMNSWYQGYKAAQSKGCYSEEQLKQAWDNCHKNKGFGYTPTFSDLINSLNQPKQLIGIDVEMEQNQCDGCRAGLPLVNGWIHRDSQTMGIACTKDRYNKPKVTDGFVNVLKYYYET